MVSNWLDCRIPQNSFLKELVYQHTWAGMHLQQQQLGSQSGWQMNVIKIPKAEQEQSLQSSSVQDQGLKFENTFEQVNFCWGEYQKIVFECSSLKVIRKFKICEVWASTKAMMGHLVKGKKREKGLHRDHYPSVNCFSETLGSYLSSLLLYFLICQTRERSKPFQAGIKLLIAWVFMDCLEIYWEQGETKTWGGWASQGSNFEASTLKVFLRVQFQAQFCSIYLSRMWLNELNAPLASC